MAMTWQFGRYAGSTASPSLRLSESYRPPLMSRPPGDRTAIPPGTTPPPVDHAVLSDGIWIEGALSEVVELLA